MMSEVIDEADDVAFVDDIRGQNGQRCAVYFRGGDIAVVNLDKKSPCFAVQIRGGLQWLLHLTLE